VPCRSADASAWWPDRRDLHSSATRGAIAACCRCPLRHPCAEYAIAADERFRVWGATLPEERRTARLMAAVHFEGATASPRAISTGGGKQRGRR
jgi:WhiB family redox-sensing transcriptional regulator